MMETFKTFFLLGHDPGLRDYLISAGFVYVDLKEADIIVYAGGEDIGTEIYNESPVLRSIPKHRSVRDVDEMVVFETYPQKFKLGICRGSQMLNCLNGGTLWQHVDQHTRSHDMIDTRTGETIKVTSTHHQQMRPDLTKGELLAFATECKIKMADGIVLKPTYENQQVEFDAEIVWYPGTRTLCVQGHPEYVPESRFGEYVISLINEMYEYVAA